MESLNSRLKTPYSADDNLSKRAMAALDTMTYNSYSSSSRVHSTWSRVFQPELNTFLCILVVACHLVIRCAFLLQ